MRTALARESTRATRQVRIDQLSEASPGCGRAVGHAVQGHPLRNPRGSRRGRPLHALACTTRLRTVAKPFTQFQNAVARARLTPREARRARPPQIPKHRATRCRAPRASCCPSAVARRRPAAPSVAPRRRSRLAARALGRFATNRPAWTPSGARLAALQPARPARPATRRAPVARFDARCCMLGAPRAAHINNQHPRGAAQSLAVRECSRPRSARRLQTPPLQRCTHRTPGCAALKRRRHGAARARLYLGLQRPTHTASLRSRRRATRPSRARARSTAPRFGASRPRWAASTPTS